MGYYTMPKKKSGGRYYGLRIVYSTRNINIYCRLFLAAMILIASIALVCEASAAIPCEEVKVEPNGPLKVNCNWGIWGCPHIPVGLECDVITISIENPGPHWVYIPTRTKCGNVNIHFTGIVSKEGIPEPYIRKGWVLESIIKVEDIYKEAKPLIEGISTVQIVVSPPSTISEVSDTLVKLVAPVIFPKNWLPSELKDADFDPYYMILVAFQNLISADRLAAEAFYINCFLFSGDPVHTNFCNPGVKAPIGRKCTYHPSWEDCKYYCRCYKGGTYNYEHYKKKYDLPKNQDAGFALPPGTSLVFEIPYEEKNDQEVGLRIKEYQALKTVYGHSSDEMENMISTLNYIYEGAYVGNDYGKVQHSGTAFNYYNLDSVTQINQDLTTSLVLDRSGSMKGEKLKKAKQAAESYIDDMKRGECGAVIAFSTTAETLKEIQCIGARDDEKDDLKKAIGKISATNRTNIADGLAKGADQLKDTPTKAVALLLSDGKHNTSPFGDVKKVAEKYKSNYWKIFTVAFGKDADLNNLCEIARITDGACAPAEIENLVSVFQLMSNYARDKSIILKHNEYLRPDKPIRYEIPFDPNPKVVTFYASWQGSSLEIILIQPDGKTLMAEDLQAPLGRHEVGKTYQMLEVYNPRGGNWVMELRWADPPAVGEQVNILVSEKSDIFANILPFHNEYRLNQPVDIKVQVAELVGNKRVFLKKAAVHVEIKKPGPEMIRMVQARSQRWTMYKDVMLDITRDVILFDNGAHDDYNPNDGIFGNTFPETDKKGAYLVTAKISGEKQNGEKIEKTLRGSFQVGPISQNIVTTSQVLQYMDQAKSHIDDKTPYKEDILRKPLKEIKRLQGDPLDSINKLLKQKK